MVNCIANILTRVYASNEMSLDSTDRHRIHRRVYISIHFSFSLCLRCRPPPALSFIEGQVEE